MKESLDVGYVIWADAMIDRKQMHVPEHRPYLMLTAGVIVRNDAHGVSLAQDVSEEGTLREAVFIPRVNIRDVRILAKGVVERAPQFVSFPPGAAEKPKKQKRRGKKK